MKRDVENWNRAEKVTMRARRDPLGHLTNPTRHTKPGKIVIQLVCSSELKDELLAALGPDETISSFLRAAVRVELDLRARTENILEIMREERES